MKDLDTLSNDVSSSSAEEKNRKEIPAKIDKNSPYTLSGFLSPLLMQCTLMPCLRFPV